MGLVDVADADHVVDLGARERQREVEILTALAERLPHEVDEVGELPDIAGNEERCAAP